ncbi:MAG: hypothetical protein ACI8RZ_006953 [Myxococcota bacterium]
MIIWFLACSGATETGDFSAADSADSAEDTETIDTIDTASDAPWTVAQLGLLEGSVGWLNGTASSYTADGSLVTPSMTFGFFTEAFILGLDDTAWCQGSCGAVSL